MDIFIKISQNNKAFCGFPEKVTLPLKITIIDKYKCTCLNREHRKCSVQMFRQIVQNSTFREMKSPNFLWEIKRSVLFFLTWSFIYLKGRLQRKKERREWERQREIFHLLVHFSNGSNSQGWAKPKSVAWNSIWASGAQALKPYSAAFPDAWVVTGLE